MTAPTDAGGGTEVRGIFDGFEVYSTPTPDDYRRVFADGLVVLDANVLLNLYRYTAEARDDLLAVLRRLTNRLWIPHQVLVEFWRNRESVLRDPRDTQKTADELSGYHASATKSVRTWANRVSLPADRREEMIQSLDAGFESVTDSVDEFADASAVKAMRDTNTDTVLQSLDVILSGRVGPPLDDETYATAVAEGLRRVDSREPPGYMDKKKDDESAAGDYLLWEQILRHAERSPCDIILVTGDVKEDWWRQERGEPRGPRTELAKELRQRSGGRLFLLRPTQLLTYAKSLLEIPVREESVRDADRVEELLSEYVELPHGGWDAASLTSLLKRLAVEAPVQEKVVRLAARQGGYITREQVYEAGDYAATRSLRGFTRPINRLAQLFRDEGIVPEAAVDILWAVYGENSPEPGWAAGFRMHEDVLPLLKVAPEAEDDDAAGAGAE